MTHTEFRAALERLNLNQSSLARLMHELGDPRRPATILRTIANWARGVTTVPGEMVVVLHLLEPKHARRVSRMLHSQA